IAHYMPPLNAYVHGSRDEIPHLVYRRWKFMSGLLAENVDWLEFDGDRRVASDLPKKWNRAVMLGTERKNLVNLERESKIGGVLTYFYQLYPGADAVMAAVVPAAGDSQYNGNFVGKDDVDYVGVASRVGKDALRAT